MAKKQKTNEQEVKLITEAAERVMEKKSKIKELQAEIDKDLEVVKAHALKTGERRYGKVQVYERTSNKLSMNMEEKELTEIFKKRRLYKYTALKLDKKEIIEQADSDEDLQKLLIEMSVVITTETELHLKYF
jgi:hypothetical protein